MCIVESGEDEELKALSEAFCFLRLKKKHELVVITGLDVHLHYQKASFTLGFAYIPTPEALLLNRLNRAHTQQFRPKPVFQSDPLARRLERPSLPILDNCESPLIGFRRKRITWARNDVMARGPSTPPPSSNTTISTKNQILISPERP
ncbi:hypothetical protein FQA47_011851 [Oryzias melastigma]|uniref:Uncharacterized protein n=1 Tax=Oryzias melastigma TaxID=30732 RepID=A0A834CPE2_ORYME|nr:hypothetical protein FQA47_011851 [Oryzias melastigma]